MQKKIILVLLFALIVAIFAIQNASIVTIKIFQWQGEVSLAFVILGAIVFGALIIAIVTSFTQLKLGKKIRNLKKENQEKEEEIEQLHETIEDLEEENLKLKDEDIIVKVTEQESDEVDIEDIRR